MPKNHRNIFNMWDWSYNTKSYSYIENMTLIRQAIQNSDKMIYVVD